MDILELLLFYKKNPLPTEQSQRCEILTTLITNKLFYIFYEDVCEYCMDFKDIYPINRIKALLRNNRIKGNDINAEISRSKITEEEKLLLYFFFKGKVQ